MSDSLNACVFGLHVPRSTLLTEWAKNVSNIIHIMHHPLFLKLQLSDIFIVGVYISSGLTQYVSILSLTAVGIIVGKYSSRI